MSLNLRISLIVVSVLSFWYVMRRINKSQMAISDTVYWIAFSVALVILSIFPQIVDWIRAVLGIATPVNCVYLIIIFLLLFKVFSLSVKVSQLEAKQTTLVQRYAIDWVQKEKKADPDENTEEADADSPAGGTDKNH